MCIKISAYILFYCLTTIVQSGFADELKLSPSADLKVFTEVLSHTAAEKIKDPFVFQKQSFRFILNGVDIGTLVTGRGITHRISDGYESRTCFAAFAKNNGQTDLSKTIGNDSWESLSCLSILAVGSVSSQPNPATGCFQIIVLHEAASTDTNQVVPIVFSLDKQMHHFDIDQKATANAFLAGAKTIADVRSALKR